MKYYLGVIKNYALFSGRARRMEYWMFVVINFLFTFLAEILDRIFHTTFTINGAPAGYHIAPGGNPFTMMGATMGFGYIWLLYSLFIFLPSLAVLVRRLHDVNKSGWIILLFIIPALGLTWLLVLLDINKSVLMVALFLIFIVEWIWLLVLLFTNGTYGVNKYGPNPKGTGNGQFDSIDA